MKKPKLEIYPDEAGEFRWRLISKNYRITADSGEGYKTRQGARKAAHRLPGMITDAVTVELP